LRVVEGEQEEDRQTPQAEQQHDADDGLAALEHGHVMLNRKASATTTMPILVSSGCSRNSRPMVGEDVVAGHLTPAWRRARAGSRGWWRTGDEEDPEHQQRQLRAE
jgi:hypothetical protein